MKKAVVTLTVGKKHEALFNEYCKNSWSEYCMKFDYELIVITELLDKSERALQRSPAWQKLLILSQSWSSNYDRILWIDSDIIINTKNAVDISEMVPINMVGGVDQYAIPTENIYKVSLKRLYDFWKYRKIPYTDNLESNTYYSNRGLPINKLKKVLQTGVVMCSPAHHRDKFEYIYNNYEDTHGADWNYEMPAMSYELVKDDLVTWLPSQYNFCVIDIISAFYQNILVTNRLTLTFKRVVDKMFAGKLNDIATKKEFNALKNIYELSCFMHFAGCTWLMPKMKRIIER